MSSGTGRRRLIKPLDAVAFALAACLVGLSAAMAFDRGNGDAMVAVEAVDGSYVYPLDRDRLVSVRGPLGLTVVEISGGLARILSSPCPNQTCVAQGAVSGPGQWAACLPNKVLVRVERSAKEGEVDAATY